jgi:hypothetical protein
MCPSKVKGGSITNGRLWYGSADSVGVWPSIAQLVERWTVVVIVRHP